MFDTFIKTLGEGLAGQWNARNLTPALAFWASGVLAYGLRFGWTPFLEFIAKQDVTSGVILLVAGSFLLTVSIALVNWLTLPVLRLAEGYWPEAFKSFRAERIERINRDYSERLAEYNQLYHWIDEKQSQDREMYNRYARLGFDLYHYPVDLRLRLPTRLGNILRAAEEYPPLVYGLSLTTTWPVLWLILPETSKTEVSEARERLDESVRLCIWGLAFGVWILWSLWGIPVSAAILLVGYIRMHSTALDYARFLRAVYDLHRLELYKALSFEGPPDLSRETEKLHGQALSGYLLRHSHSPLLRKAEPEKSSSLRRRP